MSKTALTKRLRLLFIATLLTTLALSLRPVPIARAATITVNSTADTIANDGQCTLHEAIHAANTDTASGGAAGECAAGSGDDTIDLTGISGTINLTGSLPDITSNIVFNGPGASNLTVWRYGVGYRIFTVVTGTTVTISGMTISNGRASSGGGIHNAGTVTLNYSTVSHNGAGDGGGIYNAGTMTLNYSTISRNGADHDGGGIHNAGTMTLNHSTVSGNGASSGGGIYNTGTVTLNCSTVSDNGADHDGGGIYSTGSGSSVMLNNSTVSNNRSLSGSSGGGIWNSDGASMEMTNGTVSGNASSRNGGGINNTRNSTLTLNNSTIGDNSAGSGGGIWNDGDSTVNFKNSIIAGNTASSGHDCRNVATFTSGDYNLVGDNSGCPFTPQPNDQVNVDPLLGLLRDNGGATETHALQTISPAIDAIPIGNCTDHQGQPITTDQRGIARPQGAACDIGAYEVVQNVFTVTKTDDTNDGSCDGDCSLREAVIAANATSGPAAINVPAGIYTLTIAGADEDAAATGDLDITDDLTISGAGEADTIIDGGGLDRVFHVIGSIAVEIAGVTIQHGELSTGHGAGILNNGGTVTLTNSTVSNNNIYGRLYHGGGIHNEGTLTLNDSTVISNSAKWNGAGIFLQSGTVMLTNTTVISNSSEGSGGGIYIVDGTVTLTNTTVSSNCAEWEGAGIYNESGTVTLTNSTVNNNNDHYRILGLLEGGGICNSGILTLNSSIISNNSAEWSGGGILNWGTATLNNTTVISNSAEVLGGGISNWGTATLNNTTVISNSAEVLGGGGILNQESSMVNLINSAIISNSAGSSGGGILNQYGSVLLLTDSTVVSNSTERDGGGVCNAGGTVTLTHSTVISNSAGGRGGGIFNVGLDGEVDYYSSTATIIESIISSNIAVNDGGGIYNADTSAGSGSSVALTDSTVSNNRSLSGSSGGGIWNSDGASMELTNSTVSGNVSSGNGGGINNTHSSTLTLNNSTISDSNANSSGGGIWNDDSSTVNFKNSIIAGNTASTGPDCRNAATFVSGDYNLMGDDSGCFFTPQVNDQVNVDPLLGPLQLNPPGNTETHALLTGSPAIDAIPIGNCTDHQGTPITTDQRGVSRPQSAACDIGAYEAQDADLNLSKTVGEVNPSVGETVVFTIQATNNGPLGATGVVISDPLPLGLTFASANTSQGSYTSTTGEWNVGGLTVGLSATLTITATVDAGTVGTTITNTATLAAADQFDPDVANNTAMAAVTATDVPVAGLIATNDGPTPLGDTTTLTATVTAGSNVTYTWAFGDEETGSGAVVTHTYAAVRDYTAVVTASNSVSMLTATTIVTVNEPHPAPDSYVYLPLVMRAHP